MWLTACLRADSPYKADAMLSGSQQGGYLYFFPEFFEHCVAFDLSQVEDAVQDFTHIAKEIDVVDGIGSKVDNKN